jgi:hypothetical protein
MKTATASSHQQEGYFFKPLCGFEDEFEIHEVFKSA